MVVVVPDLRISLVHVDNGRPRADDAADETECRQPEQHSLRDLGSHAPGAPVDLVVQLEVNQAGQDATESDTSGPSGEPEDELDVRDESSADQGEAQRDDRDRAVQSPPLVHGQRSVPVEVSDHRGAEDAGLDGQEQNGDSRQRSGTVEELQEVVHGRGGGIVSQIRQNVPLPRFV